LVLLNTARTADDPHFKVGARERERQVEREREEERKRASERGETRER
jgi:hypothetical protein